MRTSTQSPRRGRPPAYDRERALRAVRDAFWRGGFSATSLDALASAAGMNRPSLYGAFGDKRAMYLAALAAFGADTRAFFEASLAEPRLSDALGALYRGAIEVYLGGEGARGCFVSGTAPVEAPADPVIRQALAAIFADMDSALAARLDRALAGGELPAHADPAALAKVATAVIHSLGLRARAGAPRAELEALAAQAVKLLAP